ncbi:MAG: orotate phosphoribosyltransferase [Thermoanaerobaculia bacterium]|jgi:orotate phosphoribosyltransferase|nr:orotate phosphoribosyltransferase [Thermoanaerobaculia bacterium]
MLTNQAASEHLNKLLLATIRRTGHFLLESGYHADTWFDLDALFIDPAAIAPQVDALTDLIRPHDVSAICGPLLGGAFLAQALAAAIGVRFYYCEQVESNSSSGLYAARYRLPAGLGPHASKERFAVVDDVISAGSSVRAVVAELESAGATTAVVGSLLVLGTKATEYFASIDIPVVALDRRAFTTWLPAECPLCRDGVPLDQTT